MAQCVATSSRTGEQCRASAIHGGTVCTAHGGRAPQVKAAAARRIARASLEGEVGRLLQQIGNEPVPDLLDGLLIAVRHMAQMVAVHRMLVEDRGILGHNRHDEEVADPAVEAYRRWLADYAAITKLALDAGIDERRTRMVEADARRLFDAVGSGLDAGLSSLGLSGEQEQLFRSAFRGAFASALRELEPKEAIA